MGIGALRRAPGVPQVGHRARQRVIGSLRPVVLAAVAAALSWYVAHTLLGHSQPFFAPIAAAIALSTSQIQRSRRIAQMVVGVLLGIVIGLGLHTLLGDSTAALGAIVLVTMVVALALGVGFFGDGMMFPNQAAASAILVVTLHRHGTGGERAIDAVIGGAMALVIGVGLFPAEPLSLLHEAERRVLQALAQRLEEAAQLMRAGGQPDDDWALAAGFEIHQQLSGLARARATARANVRIAPRRWRLREAVDAENRRTARLDLLANAVISLVRAVMARSGAGAGPPPAQLQRHLEQFAAALGRLAEAERPWPSQLLERSDAAAQGAIQYVDAHDVDLDRVLDSILRATARDLIAVINPPV